jgi:hypothetical protein
LLTAIFPSWDSTTPRAIASPRPPPPDAPPAPPAEPVAAAVFRRRPEHFLALVGQTHREPSTIVGIGRTLNQAGPNERVDRPADGRSAATHCLRHLVERGRLVRADRRKQHAASPIRPLERTVGQEVFGHRNVPGRNGGW